MPADEAQSYPELNADEPTTLSQFLDQYRRHALARIGRLTERQAHAKPLPATSLTPAGIVKHLAHMEDHWFVARVGGGELPEPWASAPFNDQPDWDFESAANDTTQEIIRLYRDACSRSREITSQLPGLDTTAPRPSFDKGPVTLRWVMVHMLEETACHVGHLDLLTDALTRPNAP